MHSDLPTKPQPHTLQTPASDAPKKKRVHNPWHFFTEARLKDYMLERIREVNPGRGDKYIRVSEQAIRDLDFQFRRVVDGYLRQQRIGKTITSP